MAPSDDKKELSGLARSIDALFDDEGGATDAAADGEDRGISDIPPDEVVWEEVEEAAPIGPNAEDADPDALRAAVDAFLTADPLERGGMGRAVREEAAALREANALDVLSDCVEKLAREAGDPPDEACLVMAQALLTPGVASRIAARLGEAREEERRSELVLVCKRLGHEMSLAITDALSSDTTDRFARRTFLDTIVEIGPDAWPIVEQMAEDTRWFAVRNAVAILGEIGGDRAVELITSSLAHTDPRVRREALLALAKVGGEDAGMLVYGMLEDPDPEARLAAAMAAGALKVERALKPLLGLLEAETDPDVTVGILRALGQLGDPGAVSAIEKRAVGSFFSRPSTDIRIAAFRALRNIGTPHAKSLLVQAADDKDPEVKSAVRQLLAMR